MQIMKDKLLSLVVFLTLIVTLTLPSDFAQSVYAGTSDQGGMRSGAKAIFTTGEGPAVRPGKTPASRPKKTAKVKRKKAKYIGISYQLVYISEDGRTRVVPNSRIFRSGERIRLLATTNQPGYLTVLNIGPTGNTHLLFKGYVEGHTPYTIPARSNLLFQGKPGTEKLLLMLSHNPTPFDSTGNDRSGATVASFDGAKDIVLEDNLETKYGVVSPENNWKPVADSSKDIILESNSGVNYGVIPASTVQAGKVLTLEVKLRHR